MSRGHLPMMPHWGPAVCESVAAFDAWDDEQRRAAGPFAGLRLLPKVSRRHVYLAWRHWPHLLCWQWILSVELMPFRPRGFEWLSSGPGCAGGLNWSLRFLWLFCLTYQRQASDRIGAFNVQGMTAPKVYYGPRAA